MRFGCKACLSAAGDAAGLRFSLSAIYFALPKTG